MNTDTKIIEQLEATFSKEFRIVDNDLGALIKPVKKKTQLLCQGLLAVQLRGFPPLHADISRCRLIRKCSFGLALNVLIRRYLLR